jgi:hypothetical protein
MDAATPVPKGRRNFAADEDEYLTFLVQQYGVINWSLIASHMPGRTSRQCKDRWTHYLSPDVVQRRWSRREDALLHRLVDEHGHKWKLLESFFPGRCDISIKNRYNVLLRKRNRELRRSTNVGIQRNLKQAQAHSPNETLEEFHPEFDIAPSSLFGFGADEGEFSLFF